MIRILVTPTRTQYWIDRGQQNGAEYELSQAFERWINSRYPNKKHIKTRVVIVPASRDKLISGLLEGRGDIAAGALTLTEDRLRVVDYGGPFVLGVKELAVSGPESPRIDSVDDLSGKRVFVRRSSSYWSHLARLNQQFATRGLAPVQVDAAPEDLRDDDILEMVGAGLVDITIVDRYEALLWGKVFPKLKVNEGVVVNSNGAFGWLIRRPSPKLQDEINQFARKFGQGTEFGNTVIKKYIGSTKYAKDARSADAMKRFKATVDFFRKYGSQYSLDYLLMIAQGYQESELKQSARSPVGAIGIMQLMPATGKAMKVGDIYQAGPNVHGGVKFTRAMIDEYFANEPMDDLNKTLFAFAAYNCGPGRVRQLRTIAAQRGLNPNVWFDNVELIAAEKIGAETVGYVSNIYKYYVAYTLVATQTAARDSAMARTARRADSARRSP